MDIEIDIALFRAQITAFSDPLVYLDTVIATNWDIATCYISVKDYGALRGSCRAYAINLMTAHLMTLNASIDTDTQPIGVVQNASEGTVSIGFTVPTSNSAYQFWLNKTPYGSQLLALLKLKGSVGFYIGGSNITQTYRRPNGNIRS